MSQSADSVPVRLIRSWSRVYTHGLPDSARKRRQLELESDMWEQLNDPSETTATSDLFGRFVRGIPADVWWRYRTLLDSRGARQRSYRMMTLTTTNWWAALTMILGIAATALALLGLVLGDTGDGGQGLVMNWLISGVLMLAGLMVWRGRPVAGSWMITGGGLLIAVSVLGIPVGVVVIATGLWTGNLVLTERRAAKLDLSPQDSSATQHWYWWIVGAALLGALGFAVLLVWPAITPDSCTEFNPCWEDTLAWATWILSWMVAALAASVGVILAGIRFARHHTRPA